MGQPHKTFIHSITGSTNKQPVARLASEQQLSLLEKRLEKLERVSGLGDADSGFSLGDTEVTLTLTDRLNNIIEHLSKQAEQLSKLSDIMSRLSQAVEVTAVNKAMMDAQVEEFSKRLTDLREAHNRQAGVINEHRDTFNSSFAVVGSRIDKVQKMAQDLDEGLSAVRARLTTHGHDGLSLIPQLSSRLQQVGQQIAGLQAGVARTQALAVRKPTDDFERLELANGSKHTFRVHKGKRGLSNPHRVSVDPFLGDKYVDLSEPED